MIHSEIETFKELVARNLVINHSLIRLETAWILTAKYGFLFNLRPILGLLYSDDSDMGSPIY